MEPYEQFLLNTDFEGLLLRNLQLMKFQEYIMHNYNKSSDFIKFEKGVLSSIKSSLMSQQTIQIKFIYILHFLIMKLEISDFDLEKEVKEEIQCMQMYFPPKNQSDINHYKQEALKVFQEFENERKIPKKFLVGKSAIEFSNAQNSIQVLYFLSEFALRNQFMNKQEVGKINRLLKFQYF
ncbi:hypothetical protein PPERSA_06030 [Pseudocohnilembus persalinus]|uniref:Uncharacterized protein n=1 Tax=Pseudocohnilembus persalinus TaxID=266149 RepID=A0A0V0QQM5_PSEPJ|nr:hypothetical protein PPERSA_06030 [Pseudocohnilembus persalinus]|eukprot:KRX04477.1 hypothetical protein PPERSA_06030 [Pseudocohnilembus persalinus]